jgi:hypothetical protein
MSPRIFISSFLVALVWLYDSVANPYDQDIRPFLEKHCVQCHGLKKQKAKLRLDTLAPDFDSLDVAAQWIEVPLPWKRW